MRVSRRKAPAAGLVARLGATTVSDVNRRPIAARRLRPVEGAAGWLIRRRATPNLISLLGMAAALAAGLAFADAQRHPWLWLLGALLVQARLMANLLDGMVAIGRGIASPVGELFNEVPDRVSDTAVFAGLGLAAGRPALGLGVALAAMATAYVRAVGKAAGQASDFCGPGAKQHRMAAVTAFAIWAATAPARLADPAWLLWLLLAMGSVTAVRRLWRLAQARRR